MSSKSTTRNATTLALIPYLNCEPFYSGLEELGMETVHEVPRVLGQMAAAGAATCGPMAVADFFRMRDRFEPLGDFGIACEGPAHSVLLFSKREIDRLGSDGAGGDGAGGAGGGGASGAGAGGGRIGLTNQSSTSVRLLQLILEKNYGAKGLQFGRGARDGDQARLLIGDEAIRVVSEGDPEYPFVYDLGEEWHGWQALPFVFARWVVSKDVPVEDRERIAATIGRALDTWTERVPDITARRGEELGLDADGIREYLGTFRYRIGPVEGFGEQTFEGMLRDEGLLAEGTFQEDANREEN